MHICLPNKWHNICHSIIKYNYNIKAEKSYKKVNTRNIIKAKEYLFQLLNISTSYLNKVTYELREINYIFVY